MKKYLIMIMVLGLTVTSCKKKERLATVTFVKGNVEISNNGTVTKAVPGDTFGTNAVIKTGDASIAIVNIGTDAELEIQPNAEFQIKKYSEDLKDLYLAAGNTWIHVNKEAHVKGFRIRTPTVAAGVRGTKFYIHKLGDFTGICHCEGEVEVTAEGNNSNKFPHQDSLSYTKNGKTVVLTPEEVKSVFGKIAHHHSMLENSPLGPKIEEVPPQVVEKLLKLVTEKYNKL